MNISDNGAGGADDGPVEQRLALAGFTIPVSAPPLAAYQPAKLVGTLVYTAGQLPMLNGELLYQGQVGDKVSLEQTQNCARQAVLNCLSAIRSVAPLDQVQSVVRMVGYINAPTDFQRHPQVLNAASELLDRAFGPTGSHVRSAVGVSSLPLGAPVEIEMTVALRG